MAQHLTKAGANIPAGTTSISSSFISPSLRCFFLRRISLWDMSILWDLDLDSQMLFSHDYPLVLNLFFDVSLQSPTGSTQSSSSLVSPCSICPCWPHSPATFQPCSHPRPPGWLMQTSSKAQPPLLVSCEPWRAHPESFTDHPQELLFLRGSLLVLLCVLSLTSLPGAKGLPAQRLSHQKSQNRRHRLSRGT